MKKRDQNVKLAFILAAAFILLFASSAAVSAQNQTGSSQDNPPQNSVRIELTAKNLRFDKDSISVAPGASVTIVFHNQDKGIPHNFAVYRSDAAETVIFQGETVDGVKTVEYRFTAPLQSGQYFFRCDVHPVQMTGTFIVL